VRDPAEKRRPHLGITAGDPAGIGPEIVVAALADGRLPALAAISVWAEPETFDRAVRAAGLEPLPRGTAGAGDDPPVEPRLIPVDAGPVPDDFAPGRPSAFSGRAAAEAVRGAAAAALAGAVDAVVTAPLSKTALRAAGVPHPGHTELLAELAGGAKVAMMFVAGDLRLTLATIHVPLGDVPRLVTESSLLDALGLTRRCLIERAGIPDPRLAVLGINPHAGEGGLFGDEEGRVVEPAIRIARGRGWRVEGPFPADSFFLRHRHDYDGILAAYHDQGLIPVKLLSGGTAVNVTLGLPFLRTSVDHGTAYDIAGRGMASADSLVEAARLAVAWTRIPGPPPGETGASLGA
jgi:4-hydroxythreonine-4-phosphate dehydrogenase